MAFEFDKNGADYSRLLRDPIRDAFASRADFFVRRKWDILVDYMEDSGMHPQATAWLDVGCGTGELLRLAGRSFPVAKGCDVSAQMLSGSSDLDVVLQTDRGRLPFAAGAFDLVTAVCVYHHVRPAERAALTAEIARVLRPGGTACMIEHNPFNLITQLIVRRTPVDAGAHLLRAETAVRLFAACGLAARRVQYFLLLPEMVYSRMRVVERWLAPVPLGGQFAVFALKETSSCGHRWAGR